MSSGNLHEDEKVQEVAQSEAATDNTPRRTRKERFVAILKRFWWLFLIILIIVVLVVVLPIIYVAVPKIIRQHVNESKLTVDGISVLNTQTKSIHLGINTTVRSSSSQSATIDAFNASLYLTDKLPHTPFVTIEFPEVHSHKVVGVNYSAEVPITDEQAFADYNSWYLFNESFRVTIDGWTHVHVGSLPSTKVHFLKTVNLTGLNAFSGFNITSSSISLTPDAQGDNFHGFASIPNPSVLTVEFGNISLSNFLNGNNIGTAFIDDFLYVPGINNVSLRANISQLPVLGAVTAEPACNTGKLPFSFIGENISNVGQELPYFEQAFRANNLSLDLNIGADLAAINFTVSCSSSL